MSFKLYNEIFDEFDKAPTRKEKIEVLRKYDNPRFREFFALLFNPAVEFDVEIPPYRPSVLPMGLNDCYIQQEIPKLYRFVKNHPKRQPGLHGERQTGILVPILEGLYKEEAEIFVKFLKKNLGVKFLTENLVKEAFPGINL